MSKNLGEIINNIMKENATKQVMIITDNMYIIGTVHDYHDDCKNCHDCLIALKNVKISKIEDLGHCKFNECECNFEAFLEYKWFNVSTNAIVGFSILG
ncbi:hypothetical protein IJ472_03590 [bacterium]|nr:hypothetical protein [bacterium]